MQATREIKCTQCRGTGNHYVEGFGFEPYACDVCGGDRVVTVQAAFTGGDSTVATYSTSAFDHTVNGGPEPMWSSDNKSTGQSVVTHGSKQRAMDSVRSDGTRVKGKTWTDYTTTTTVKYPNRQTRSFVSTTQKKSDAVKNHRSGMKRASRKTTAKDFRVDEFETARKRSEINESLDRAGLL